MKKKKKDIVMGFVPSILDGTEHVFGNGIPQTEVPSIYSYQDFLPGVLNQGAESICVPCSVSAYLNWRENLKTGDVKDNGVDYHEIYNIKTNLGDGMTFKEAFHYLRHHGVSSKVGNMKINEYAMVRSDYALKLALLMNGPCVGALPVYSDRAEFWKKKSGDNLYGFHAISIVGFDKEGFIIRNSWGTEFGKHGYTKLKYEDFNNFLEIWTVVS
jgi:hypothetical protein